MCSHLIELIVTTVVGDVYARGRLKVKSLVKLGGVSSELTAVLPPLSSRACVSLKRPQSSLVS